MKEKQNQLNSENQYYLIIIISHKWQINTRIHIITDLKEVYAISKFWLQVTQYLLWSR